MQLAQLPDDVLGRVLALAGRDAASATSRVCKRWRRLVFDSPALWHSLDLDPASKVRQDLPPQRSTYHWDTRDLDLANVTVWLARMSSWVDGKRSLLRRVGRHVRSFGLCDCALLQSATLQDLLAQLQPEQLWELRLGESALSAATLGMLPRLHGLTRLELTERHEGLPRGSLNGLAALRRLRHLRCNARRLPPGMAACIAQATQLTLLSLVTESPPPDVGPLTALLQLEQLRLIDKSFNNGPAQLVLPSPAAHWPRLRAYRIARKIGSWQVDDFRVHSACYGESREFTSKGDREDGLWLWSEAAELALNGAVGLAPLLLETLLPQGTALGEPALTALSLSGCSGPPAGAGLPPVVPARWASLGKLRRLSLGCTDCNDGTWGDAILAALLDQAPELEALSLSSCKLTQVPPMLAAAPRPGLTELALSFNELTDLPPGDWLAGLHSLGLSENPFARLPRALSAATALTALRLRTDWSRMDALRLTPADVQLLAALPNLQEVKPAYLQQQLRQPDLRPEAALGSQGLPSMQQLHLAQAAQRRKAKALDCLFTLALVLVLIGVLVSLFITVKK